jgi:hypothetical protein
MNPLNNPLYIPPPNEADSGRFGVKLIFNAPGATSISGGPKIKRSCSDIYYLNVLGKMELSGIPQVTHEKLICNTDDNRLVPGLYKNIPDVQTGAGNKGSFNNASFAFNTNSNTWYTNYHGLANEPIFSPNDFKCCTPAGKLTRDPSTCCTGKGIEDGDEGTLGGRAQYRCVLPSGANLSVYLNRFVSNEGRGNHLNVTPLTDADFNRQTGEPLVNSTVNNKISAIGRKICESGETRRGAAFGEFRPQPSPVISSGATIYGIVDSSADNGTSSSGGGTDNVGYFEFMNGFRWNHHIYCR